MADYAMAFLHTLPEEIQKKAWDQKSEDLLDAWFDSYIGDAGDELPNYCEEQLLGLLTSESEDGTDYLQLAKDFYEKLDAEGSTPL